MPINLTGTLINSMHQAGTLAANIQTAKNTEALKAHQEELENWQGDDWSQAPQGSKQQVAYQRASDAYYDSINEKALNKERREFLKTQLGRTKGRPTSEEDRLADIHISDYLEGKAQGAKENIQSSAEHMLMSPVARAQEAYDSFHEYLREKYGGGTK